MQIDDGFDIDMSRASVWEHVRDPQLMVRCIPGCVDIEQIDPTHYRAAVQISLGLIKAHFDLMVEVTREDPPNAIYAITRGDEGTRASVVSADTVVRLTDLPGGGTRVDYESEVHVTGRLGKFGLGMMRKKAAILGEEFAEQFRKVLTGDTPEATSDTAADVAEPDKSGGWRGLFRRKADIPVESSAKRVADPRSAQSVLQPQTVKDAVNHLIQSDGVLPLAGGATLIAMKNANLVHADHFVSLEGIAEMRGISVSAAGAIRIGAMTRHCETADSDVLTGTHAVLKQAAGRIANPPVRNMGTIGGSVANADPAADYLTALTCLDAQLELAGPNGRRRIPIAEFLVDWHETALQRAELIVAVHLPPAEKGHAQYYKMARVSGDFATANCAISVTAQPSPSVQIAVGGCGPQPIRSKSAERQLVADGLSQSAIAAFADTLAGLADPVDDVRGSAEYRKCIIPRMVTQAIETAMSTREDA
ncbi:FAD binding domain-containing protein [Ruegeria lacuscaerulensis]|uniref:FAD binding domain-containing protein n=1 Tax=Ruegeria lacuscaerulensis TaxID=55218 RepID=UPI00147D7A01|nr:FAD binding domain-containing protein [Ruegeria lacuscaerulensis]